LQAKDGQNFASDENVRTANAGYCDIVNFEFKSFHIKFGI